jgi:hypothetical protein
MPGSLPRRVLWFVALYIAGVAVTAAVAFALKAVLPG